MALAARIYGTPSGPFPKAPQGVRTGLVTRDLEPGDSNLELSVLTAFQPPGPRKQPLPCPSWARALSGPKDLMGKPLSVTKLTAGHRG